MALELNDVKPLSDQLSQGYYRLTSRIMAVKTLPLSSRLMALEFKDDGL